MAQLEHLALIRLPERLERRKPPGFGIPPDRKFSVHGEKLHKELDASIAEQVKHRTPKFIDPSLILRVKMIGAPLEEEWEKVGLTLLSSDDDKTLVLFSTSDELTEFRRKITSYQGEKPKDQIGQPFAGFISNIEEIGTIEAKDRIGIRLKEEGFTETSDFQNGTSYTLDIELWDLGRPELRLRKIGQIADYLSALGGELVDQYSGPSITMLRAKIDGSIVRALLGINDIAVIDMPPQIDSGMAEAISLTIADLPPIGPVPEGAPIIGIIDSGINDHPLLAGAIAGSVGVPASLGTADDWGHGTRVAGIAIFGDLRTQIRLGELNRRFRIVTAKVVNDQGKFDEHRLVPSQMREAITSLHENFGCRIFVVALGDEKRVYDGAKVGPWASTLDELAAELDVVIIVSSGNRSPRSGGKLEQAVTDYPKYLLEPTNRLCEPAGAANVLTVGALANGEGLDEGFEDYVGVQTITRFLEPSPFTRIGPGVQGAIKPDIVDVGGTIIFDPAVARLRGGGEISAAGVLTLNHQFIEHLFTAGSGTSYAAPLVAHKAGTLLSLFPHASANLIRALLVGAAEIPKESEDKLASLRKMRKRQFVVTAELTAPKLLIRMITESCFSLKTNFQLITLRFIRFPFLNFFNQEGNAIFVFR